MEGKGEIAMGAVGHVGHVGGCCEINCLGAVRNTRSDMVHCFKFQADSLSQTSYTLHCVAS